MSDAEGNFSPRDLAPRDLAPRDLKEFDKQSNKKLKDYGRKIVKTGPYEFLKFILIALIIGICVLGYGIYDDKFKTEIPDCVCPACPTIPECPASPSCPQNNCSNICNFPSELNIVTNSS